MAGIRIRHATMRSGMGLIQEPRPLQPYFCPRCAAVNPRMAMHAFKTHHIDIDSEGYAIVSVTVLERLRSIGMAGFEICNEVASPPTQGINSAVTVDGRPVAPTIAGAYLLEGAEHG